MLTLGIVLAVVGVVLWIIGFILHATLLAGEVDRGIGGGRMVVGPILVVLGNLAFWGGAIILGILGIIWIVAQLS